MLIFRVLCVIIIIPKYIQLVLELLMEMKSGGFVKKRTLFIFLFCIVLFGCSTRQEIPTSDRSLVNEQPLLFEEDSLYTDTLISARTALPKDVEIIEGSFENVTILYPFFNNENADTAVTEELNSYFNDKSFKSDTAFDFFISEGQGCISIIFYDNTSASSSMRNVFAITLSSDYSEHKDITSFIKSHTPLQHIYETVDKLYGNEGAFKTNSPPEFFVDKRGIVVIDSLGQRFSIPKDNFNHIATRKVTVGKSYAPVINQNEKVIALTFDDGPNYLTTSSLLSMLKEKDVKATFFAVGYNIIGNEYLLKRMLDQGCDVGIHSYSHGNFNNMTYEETMDDIYKCSDLIKSATGVSPHLVRPPFGNISDEIVNEKEYYYINWCIDPLDYLAETPEQIADHVCKYARSGGIVLLHDIHQVSCDAAEMIIDRLSNDGWRFVTVSELFDMKNNPPSGKIYYGLGY